MAGGSASMTSLGYEPYDERLQCLGKSLIITLTSADLRCEVGSVLPCLPRLKLSRCVRFTNRFTEPLPGLRIPAVPAGVTSLPLWRPGARHCRWDLPAARKPRSACPDLSSSDP